MAELRFTIEQNAGDDTEKVIVRYKDRADDERWIHAGTLFLSPKAVDLLRDLMREGAAHLDDTSFESFGNNKA